MKTSLTDMMNDFLRLRETRTRISDRLGTDLIAALLSIQTQTESLSKSMEDNERVQQARVVILAAVRRALQAAAEVTTELRGDRDIEMLDSSAPD